jgi:hypothetical protein
MTEAEPDLERAVRARRRREPRYGAFLVTGIGGGLVVATVLALLADPPSGYSRAWVFGLLAAAAVLLGGLLGGLAAVLAARRGGAPSAQVTSRTKVDPSADRVKPTRGK